MNENGYVEGGYLEKPIPRDYGQSENYWTNTGLDEWKEKFEKLPRLKMTRGQIRFLKGIILLLFILLVAFSVVQYIMGPGRVVKNMFRAEFVKGDTEYIYQKLDLPEGAFLTKENFLQGYGEKKALDITNIEIVKRDDYKVSAANDEEEILDFIAKYTVYYTIKGDSTTYSKDYELVREGNLFPDWKVRDTSGLVAQNSMIYAPENVQITLDGILLDASYLEPVSYDGEERSGNCYVVDVFSGTHVLEAQSEYMEPGRFEVDFHGAGDYYELPALELNENTKEMLYKEMENVMAGIYDAAENDEGIMSLAEKFTEKGMESLSSTYSYIYERMHDIKDVSFGNRKFYDVVGEEIDSYSYNGTMEISMQISYSYYYNYAYTYSSWYGGDERRTQEDSAKGTMEALFALQGDTWKIDEIYLRSIY